MGVAAARRECCGYYNLQAMVYTAEDVVGLLVADGSYIDSSDDDLGFEYDSSNFHAVFTPSGIGRGRRQGSKRGRGRGRGREERRWRER